MRNLKIPKGKWCNMAKYCCPFFESHFGYDICNVFRDYLNDRNGIWVFRSNQCLRKYPHGAEVLIRPNKVK